MIYDIRHITSYRYETPVASAAFALRLLPRLFLGQRVVRSRLSITPRPADETSSTDFFGNSVTFARIEARHSELVLEANSRVIVERDEPVAAGLTPAWEAIRDAAHGATTFCSDGPAHHLYPSRLVRLHDPATAYAARSFSPKRPMLEAACELMGRIRRDFAYDAAATAVETTVAEAFERRRGVCQDFAHVMIAGLRGLGLPASYVSGYIRTTPPKGGQRLEGADASHAWVGVWCGAEFGWVGLDPTNDMSVGDDHVVLAVGRDYADVSPTAGVFIGSGAHALQVSVDVRPASE